MTELKLTQWVGLWDLPINVSNVVGGLMSDDIRRSFRSRESGWG